MVVQVPHHPIDHEARGEAEQAQESQQGKPASWLLNGLLREPPLIGGGICQRHGGAIDNTYPATTPQRTQFGGRHPFPNHPPVNLGQPIHRNPTPGLAVGTLCGFARSKASVLPERTGLENGFPAGSPWLGGLPEEGPESQPQWPVTVAGMNPLILLREQRVLDPSAEDLLERMNRHAASPPQPDYLGSELRGPCWERRRHGTVAILSH